MDNEFETGICKWFASGGQSYGYIEKDSGGEVYVHYKNITDVNQRDSKYRDLQAGDKVRFKLGEGFRNTGTQAVEVEILDYAEL